MTKVCRIEIDPSAGFCFGVENAIKIAESEIKNGQKVFGLGHMVHNEEEIVRLEKAGLYTISVTDLPKVRNGKVLIRAHGEPPSTYKLAEENNVSLIDATCPIVLKLQKKIREKWISLNHSREQLAIYGKRNHPETIGLLGQTGNKAILLTSREDIKQLDPAKRTFLYSQTTMDPEQFGIIEDELRRKSIDYQGDSSGVISDCSICGQMKRRKPALRSFAEKHNQVVFICGKNSSNGRMLYEYCRKHNSETHLIHAPEDVSNIHFQSSGSVGITGATSTPLWQLEKVRYLLLSLMKD